MKGLAGWVVGLFANRLLLVVIIAGDRRGEGLAIKGLFWCFVRTAIYEDDVGGVTNGCGRVKVLNVRRFVSTFRDGV